MRIDGFGLFSVPAPPFRFPASGGVFIFLAGLLLQSWFAWAATACAHSSLKSTRLIHVMHSTPWHLDGRTATLTLPQLSLAFDANEPGEGLKNICVGDQDWEMGRLFGVTGPIQAAAKCELADWYVRGDDLIAAYETGQPDSARIDLRWQVAEPAEGDSTIARIDLLASIRTDRLDWRHDVTLESVIPAAAQCTELAPNNTWFACDDWNWSLDFVVHSSDLRRRELRSDSTMPGTQLLRLELFPTEMLEKGVILRARAAAIFIAAKERAFSMDGLAHIIAESRAFFAADPPLGI